MWIHRFQRWTSSNDFFAYDLDAFVEPEVEPRKVLQVTHEDWKTQGLCHGADDALFFGTQEPYVKLEKAHQAELALQEQALIICDDCPVRRECLEHALIEPEYYGVWGSSTPYDRVQLRHRLGQGETLESVMDDFLEG